MKMIYILSNYPSRTEAFIQREIDALRKNRAQISIYALRSENRSAHADQVRYRGQTSIFLNIRTFIEVFYEKPRVFMRVFRYLSSYLKHPVYLIKLIRNVFYILSSTRSELPEIDWIHAHFSDMAADLAIILHFISAKPVTFSAHARDIFAQPRNLFEKSRIASAVFVCSQFAAGYLDSEFQIKNLHVIYHGLDLSEPLWSKHFGLRLNNIQQFYEKQDEKIFLSVGRFIAKKGFSKLIIALSGLKKDGFKFQCKIIGRGPLKKKLQKQIDDLQLNDRVGIYDFMPFDELVHELLTSHLLIQPSILADDGDQDNIPNVILEAQALGIPTLATPLPGIKEVIQHQVTGFITPSFESVDIARAIKDVFSDLDRLERIVVNAKSQIDKNFDSIHNVQKMIRVWSKLMH